MPNHKFLSWVTFFFQRKGVETTVCLESMTLTLEILKTDTNVTILTTDDSDPVERV